MKKQETEQALQQYNYFLETGELLDLFPNMTGEWNMDKKVFLVQWEKNKEFLNEL